MERKGGGAENSGAESSMVGQYLLTFLLFFAPASGDRLKHCSEFLCFNPHSPQLRILRLFSAHGLCGFHIDLPSPGLHTKQDSLGFPSPPHALCPMAWSPEGPSWFPIGPTVMIVPGRRPARLQPSWVRQMADKLLKAGLVNVLVADWLLPPHDDITEGARQVGERLAQAIQTLVNQHGFSPELFHLVGFGVGAHVAGIAGACLEGAVGRITGLDPFSPQFSEADSRLSLDYTDAQYVDVIHTNFNANEPIAALGVSRPLGHVDFYVGRGHLLPGCPHALMKRERYILCSHQWAYRLFTSSIGSSCPITAFPCLGVEDYQKALCTSCHHPGLNTCPLLGYDISWLPPDRPIGFQPVTAVLGIAVKEPFCVSPFLLEVHLVGNVSLNAQLFVQLKGGVGKTPVMLVSGPSPMQFDPHQTYQFMVSIDHRVKEFRILSLEFNSQRLLYLQWRKISIQISHLVLTQLPRHKGLVVYSSRSLTAVENQRMEVPLQKEPTREE
ncbi:lipase member I [Esox lucius]|uniref:lipase member I n=1 Tax=Esox lucius TaxID=8010 RepID=UPI001476BEC5|nr:lipase member I [Esox lucius]